MSKPYVHSGAAPSLGILMSLGAGLAAAAGLGIAYGYLMFWIPFVYLNFLMTIFFGIIIGYIVFAAGKAGKVRNSALIGVVGLVCAIAGLYFAWAGYIGGLVNKSGEDAPFVVLNPAAILDVGGLLLEKGAWTLFGGTPTGTILFILWLLEALIIVGAGGLIAWSSIGELPFCEGCDAWTEVRKGFKKLDPQVMQGAIEKLAGGDVSGLREIPASKPGSGFVRVDLATCKTCQASTFVSLVVVQMKMEKGEVKEEEADTLVKNLQISAEEYEHVKASGAPLKQA